MNLDRVFFILRIVVPILMAATAFVVLWEWTNLHWGVCLILSIGFGLIDVFILAPLTDKMTDKTSLD